MGILTRAIFLTSSVVICATSITAMSDPIVIIGTLMQVSQGSHNINKFGIVTVGNTGAKANNQTDIVIKDVGQHSVGNFNQNIISIESVNNSMISAGVITQAAYGYMGTNKLKIGDRIQTKTNVSIGDIFQSSRDGEVNEIRIGSNLMN